MMDFTRDERNLMMLYSPGTRSGLCEALLQMKEQLSQEEAELCALADSVLNKLSGMDDETFDTVPLKMPCEPITNSLTHSEKLWVR